MGSLNTLLETVAEKKKQLDSLRPLPKALVNNLQQWFVIELTYTSNVFEGNTLTRSETALIVEKGITVAGKPLKDHLEAINYASALNFIHDLAGKKRSELTIADILDIHRIILKSIDDEHAGKFRKIVDNLSGSRVTVSDSIKDPDVIKDFMKWLTTATGDHTIIAAQAHYRLAAIRPFVDGNGRTARLLMNLLLMQAGYPPVILTIEKKKHYLEEEFYLLVAQAVENSLDIYLDAAHKSIQ